jgi:hypothetical protein
MFTQKCARIAIKNIFRKIISNGVAEFIKGRKIRVILKSD